MSQALTKDELRDDDVDTSQIGTFRPASKRKKVVHTVTPLFVRNPEKKIGSEVKEASNDPVLFETANSFEKKLVDSLLEKGYAPSDVIRILEIFKENKLQQESVAKEQGLREETRDEAEKNKELFLKTIEQSTSLKKSGSSEQKNDQEKTVLRSSKKSTLQSDGSSKPSTFPQINTGLKKVSKGGINVVVKEQKIKESGDTLEHLSVREALFTKKEDDSQSISPSKQQEDSIPSPFTHPLLKEKGHGIPSNYMESPHVQHDRERKMTSVGTVYSFFNKRFTTAEEWAGPTAFDVKKASNGDLFNPNIAVVETKSWREWLNPELQAFLHDVTTLSEEVLITKYVPSYASAINPSSWQSVSEFDAYEILHGEGSVYGLTDDRRLEVSRLITKMESILEVLQANVKIVSKLTIHTLYEQTRTCVAAKDKQEYKK